MGWSSGTYTKWNGAGGWDADATLGIGIEAGRHDTQDTDFQNGINNCLTKDGQNTPTANLPMGGYKHTGAAVATSATDYMTFGQISNTTTTVSVGPITSSSTVSVNGTTPSTVPVVEAMTWSNDAVGPQFLIEKSRGATVGSYTIVQNGDELGAIRFRGSNGTGWTDAGAITVQVSGTPGATNDMPGRMLFYTTADGTGTLAERLRIEQSGLIGINNTTPTTRLDVQGPGGTSVGRYATTTAGLGTGCLLVSKFDNNTTTSNILQGFQINNGGAGSGNIVANGALNCAFAATSDERLKENIVDLPSQWDAFKALRPVEFDYKGGLGHQIGFIAQEVEEVYPDLVGAGSDGYLMLTDMAKNDARTIKVIKELMDRVEALEAQLAAQG